MANDEEYVQAQIDRAGNTGAFAGKPTPPPLTEWSQMAELTRRLIGEVEALKIVTISANSKKGSKKPESHPVLGPAGKLAELLKRRRIENHLSLRARLLPKRYGSGAAPQEQSPKEDAGWASKAASYVRRR